jgi:coproporphyrinogen III oxidase
MESNLTEVRTWLTSLQQRITHGCSEVDGQPFRADAWKKEPGEPLQGEGVTMILELGVSLVFHPRNPYAPTVHMNVRMLAALPDNGPAVYWFGGGMDLTPYYGWEEDAVHFHGVCRDSLHPFGEDKYPRFKAWCDEYFFLKHRNEPRGIGGIFFDDYFEQGFERSFAMLQSVGDHFLAAYLPILQRRKDTPFGQRERDWQLLRRGRYVEFNLVWDRGTHFGLQSGGRTESILMSMPPHAAWAYHHQPAPGSPEDELLRRFLVRRDWL